MKFPDGALPSIHYAIVMQKYPEVIEGIIRDCAECARAASDGEDYDISESVKRDILSRYGLE